MDQLSVVRIYQFAMVFLSFIFLIVSSNMSTSRTFRYVFYCALTSLVENVGYLMSLYADNLNEAKLAVKIEFMGAAYVTTCFLLFIVEYCKIKVPLYLKLLIFFFDTSVLLSIVFSDYVNFYFKFMDFQKDPIPHIIVGRGTLNTMFYLSIFLQCILGVIFPLIAIKRSHYSKYKKNCRLILCLGLLPIIPAIISYINDMKSVDFVPGVIAIGCILYVLLMTKYKVFEGVEVAHQDIIASLAEPVIIIDNEYCYMESNESAKIIFPEFQNLPFGSKIPVQAITEALDSDKDENIYVNDRIFSMSKKEVREHKSITGYSLLLMDLTDEIKKTEEMRRLAREAEEANQAKSVFLANMSHDIRTPMNGIIGMIGIAQDNIHDEQKVTEALHKARAASSHLLSLINDVLDVSKMESGKMQYQFETFHLGELLNNCIAMLQENINRMELTCTLDIEKVTHHYLIGSPIYIRRVIMNILSNSIKYNKEGGSISISCEELNYTEKETKIRFTITDTGIGMKPEFVKKIFDPFSQSDEVVKSNIQGTGLGMAIVKNVVEEFGGTIEVQSVFGQGSTFVIEIPFEVSERINDKDVTDYLELAKKMNFSEKRVLLVEDNELNQEIATYILDDIGIEVETADNGKIALDTFLASEAGYFHLIFMDVQMPIMDGYSATKEIRNSSHPDALKVPIIAMTAFAFDDDIKKAQEAGMNSHLSKPLEKEKVIKTFVEFVR